MLSSSDNTVLLQHSQCCTIWPDVVFELAVLTSCFCHTQTSLPHLSPIKNSRTGPTGQDGRFSNVGLQDFRPSSCLAGLCFMYIILKNEVVNIHLHQSLAGVWNNAISTVACWVFGVILVEWGKVETPVIQLLTFVFMCLNINSHIRWKSRALLVEKMVTIKKITDLCIYLFIFFLKLYNYTVVPRD